MKKFISKFYAPMLFIAFLVLGGAAVITQINESQVKKEAAQKIVNGSGIVVEVVEMGVVRAEKTSERRHLSRLRQTYAK